MTKILLVEDDKSLREIYGVRLLAEGYDIISAGDGEEALAMAIKDRPALIISDVMMPKISGFDMLDILRSTTETKTVKVIMMTALSSDDQRARGEQLGADRYLVKSQVGIEDVVRTVHEVLGDAPTTSSAPLFSSTPSAGAPTAPPQNPTPAATPAPTAPQAPASAPAPSQTPAPAPQTTQQSTAPPTQPDTSSPLPQPTAPFSTARPSGLGLSDRVINPLPKEANPGPDVSELMNRELSGTSDAAAVSTLGLSDTPTTGAVNPTPSVATPPPASAPAPAPQTAAPSQPQPAVTPTQPPVEQSTPPPNVNNPFTATAPTPPQPPSSGLTFEETPRTTTATNTGEPTSPAAPAANPFIHPGQ